eukprot:s5291_g2.t1
MKLGIYRRNSPEAPERPHVPFSSLCFTQGASVAGCCTFDKGIGFPPLWEHNVPQRNGENLGTLKSFRHWMGCMQAEKDARRATQLAVHIRSDFARCVGRNTAELHCAETAVTAALNDASGFWRDDLPQLVAQRLGPFGLSDRRLSISRHQVMARVAVLVVLTMQALAAFAEQTCQESQEESSTLMQLNRDLDHLISFDIT